jgi:hypothetical protein
LSLGILSKPIEVQRLAEKLELFFAPKN